MEYVYDLKWKIKRMKIENCFIFLYIYKDLYKLKNLCCNNLYIEVIINYDMVFIFF